MSGEGAYLITGAASGIGRAVLETLYGQGIRSIAAVDLNAEALAALAEAFPGIATFPCDLLDDGALTAMVSAVVKTVGPVRGFVHCAGFDRMAPIGLTKYELAESLYRIHAWVPLRLSALIAKKNQNAPGCAGVFISSLSAHDGAIGHAAYAAAKGALEGMLPSVAAELATKKIRLNAVVLGIIRTPMSAGWLTALAPEQLAKLEAAYPFGLGEPADPAAMIAFLLSDAARWITGQKFVLDGGHSLMNP